jgi:hypothetical protein
VILWLLIVIRADQSALPDIARALASTQTPSPR